MKAKSLFEIGDYCAAAAVGAATALSVAYVVTDQVSMFGGMFVGMGMGMGVHLATGLMLWPLLGGFHTMIPGSVIGMYGGMFFGMFESMHVPGLDLPPAAVGVAFGLSVITAFKLYDATLKLPVPAGDTGRRHNG